MSMHAHTDMFIPLYIETYILCTLTHIYTYFIAPKYVPLVIEELTCHKNRWVFTVLLKGFLLNEIWPFSSVNLNSDIFIGTQTHGLDSILSIQNAIFAWRKPKNISAEIIKRNKDEVSNCTQDLFNNSWGEKAEKKIFFL